MAEKEYIEREAAIAVIEEKQKELCPVGMYSRHAVYGSDREKFDAWEEIIEALEAIPAADAVEELAAFKAQITDGHFYCMRDGVLYEAKVEMPKGKIVNLPPIEFKEES